MWAGVHIGPPHSAHGSSQRTSTLQKGAPFGDERQAPWRGTLPPGSHCRAGTRPRKGNPAHEPYGKMPSGYGLPLRHVPEPSKTGITLPQTSPFPHGMPAKPPHISPSFAWFIPAGTGVLPGPGSEAVAPEGGDVGPGDWGADAAGRFVVVGSSATFGGSQATTSDTRATDTVIRKRIMRSPWDAAARVHPHESTPSIGKLADFRTNGPPVGVAWRVLRPETVPGGQALGSFGGSATESMRGSCAGARGRRNERRSVRSMAGRHDGQPRDGYGRKLAPHKPRARARRHRRRWHS
jgi:hypothetical protein